ncbi:type 1 glutamine amidotransferase [Thioclava atlantica]|uniref:Class I glutamine amidotransferase n=1 Tax=Thioclava atlantica TaxID=1317124 RepID=A0A085U175_9RHOB|nr:type 1 glutamine amidotransferase [Thioclava atlantica]KFE36722.1 class I glutamine amidotransferase [Thioclava atlantica]
MRIGILQTGQSPDVLREQAGDYPDMFEQLLAGRGLEFARYDVEHMEFPADVHDCEGWLITGSRHGAYEDHPFIPPLEAFIRKAHAAKVPMVGICFGHQIIAQALGGKVEKFAGGWAVGPQDYDFGGERIALNAWHQDQVTEPPPGATPIAQNAFCAYPALAYGDTIFTVQPHPEFRDDFVAGLMDTRGRGVVPDDLMAAARAKLGQPGGSARIADRIAEFFLRTRVPEHPES